MIEFLLVRSARGRWTLPACGSEPGETRWEAAERAAFEEAGATGRTDRRPLTTVLLDAGPWEEGGHPEVDAFLVHVERRHMPTGRDREPTWFAADEAERMLTADRRSYESAALRQLVWVACRGIVERSAPA